MPTRFRLNSTASTISSARPTRASTTRTFEFSVSTTISRSSSAAPAHIASTSVTTTEMTPCPISAAVTRFLPRWSVTLSR